MYYCFPKTLTRWVGESKILLFGFLSIFYYDELRNGKGCSTAKWPICQNNQRHNVDNTAENGSNSRADFQPKGQSNKKRMTSIKCFFFICAFRRVMDFFMTTKFLICIRSTRLRPERWEKFCSDFQTPLKECNLSAQLTTWR